MKHLNKSLIALLVFTICILTESNINAATTTPTSFKFKVLSFAVSADATNCSNPVTVFEVSGDTNAEKLANAEYIDLATSPDLGSSSTLSVGVYECAIMTLSDTIKFTAPNGEAGCDGTEQTQDIMTEQMGGTDGLEESMTVYISTGGQNATITDDFDLTEAMRAFNAPGLLLGNQLVVSSNGTSGSFVVTATDTVTDTGAGPCEMNAPQFSFTDIPDSTPSGTTSALAGTNIEPPNNCVLDVDVDDINPDSSCIHKGCPPVFEDEVWGHGSYGKNGATCDVYCLNEICDSYNGQWKQYYCFGSCN